VLQLGGMKSHMRMAAGTLENTLDESRDFRMSMDLDSMEVRGRNKAGGGHS